MRRLSLPLLLPFLLVVVEVLPHALAYPFTAKVFKKTSPEDQEFWNAKAKQELDVALKMQPINDKARNVILFLGDGMSIPTLTASRIYKGQKQSQGGEEGSLSFENFPYVALSKTYNTNKQVADSASTATAYLTGVKTNYKTLGVDSSVVYKNCTTINDNNKVYSIVKWAQDAGKRTGVVTSTRVTHATPAATYAHVADRDWECDEAISEEDKHACPHVQDIATQLVYNEPGSSLNVIMGGGYQNFDPNPVETPDNPFDTEWGSCFRQNDSNLIDVWKNQKLDAQVQHKFVRNKEELMNVDTASTEYLFGLFANGHLPYDYEKSATVPTLSELTTKAIELLQNGPKGYFLLVEGGRIDHAHHDTVAHRALDETVAMDLAVETALKMTNEEDTLIVVTADHAHTMSISGYPARGQEIIGLAAIGDDDLPYTTLMYANGPGYNYNVINDTDGPRVARPNITQEVAEAWDYEQLAAVPRDSETHGGDDVAIYAKGPMAHLFHSLHEQNYIAHVMAYASCVGNYTHTEHCNAGFTNSPMSFTFFLPLVVSLWFCY